MDGRWLGPPMDVYGQLADISLANISGQILAKQGIDLRFVLEANLKSL